MTVKAVTYYQVVCDGDPTCKSQPDDDYSAWSDQDIAEQSAIDAEWSYDERTGQHWCPQHQPSRCELGQHVRDDYESDRCTKCGYWPEDDEEMDRP